MRPRGSVWLSARKPPDITGVAPHFAEDSDPRGTASAAPAPGGGGPLGRGGWGLTPGLAAVCILVYVALPLEHLLEEGLTHRGGGGWDGALTAR